VSVVRPAQLETTALGAAYLAGLGAGLWSSEDEVAALWRADRAFEPRIEAAERAARLDQWDRAVQRTLGWAAPA
jgi:glycerol kinase